MIIKRAPHITKSAYILIKTTELIAKALKPYATTVSNPKNRDLLRRLPIAYSAICVRTKYRILGTMPSHFENTFGNNEHSV